jgi:hypothetical protein
VKTKCAFLLVLMWQLNAWAQNGAVRFSNLVPGTLNQPVYFGPPSLNLGPGEINGRAQLFLVDPGSTSLTPIGLPVPFLGSTTPNSQYFDGGTLNIPGLAPGATVTVRVHAWAFTDTYSIANVKGESQDFTITNLGTDQNPSTLLNFRSFSVLPLPEPTGFTIIVCALPLLYLFGRRIP